MKIMQVNSVYPVGSTGKIVKDIKNYLIENGYESVVCYGRGDNLDEENTYKIAPELIMKMQSMRSKLTGYAYAGCKLATYKLIQIIKIEKPDIVHLHCINSYIVNIYELLTYLKNANIPTVLTLHAEFMYTAGCGYSLECNKWKTGCGNCPQKGKGRPSSKLFDRSAEEWLMMKDAFEGFDNLIITTVSKWLFDRAKESPFFKDKRMMVVLNGIDTKNVFRYQDVSKLKKKHKIVDEKIVLHVTASFTNPIKGSNNVIKIAQQLESENIKFIIVGFDGDKNQLPKNVIAIPNIKDQLELSKFYSMADLTLLTSVKETFSMICAESLSCGTPVVGFEAGAPETISLKNYSEFVKQGDLDGLEDAIRKWLYIKKVDKKEIAEVSSEHYSKIKMASSYTEIYEAVIHGS